MKDKKNEKVTKEKKVSPAEKPVSLWGAPFADVMKALLNTKPMPNRSGSEDKASKVGDE